MTDYGEQDADATQQLRVVRGAPVGRQHPPQRPAPPEPFPVQPEPFPVLGPADHPSAAPTHDSLRRPLIVSGVIGLLLVLAAVGFALRDGTPDAKASTIGASSAPAPAPKPIPTSAAQSRYVSSMIEIDQFFGLDPVRTTRQGKAICGYLETGPTRAEALAYAQKRLTGGTFQLTEAQLVKAIGDGRTYLCPSAPIAR